MKTPSEYLTILVIEDNPADLFLIEEMLRSSTLNIKEIYSADRSALACELLKKHDINLVLSDLSLPDSFGVDSFLKIKPYAQKIPVIILTGMSDSEVALEILKHGAQDYLVKGEFNSSLLKKSVEYSIERKRAEEKILASEEKYRQLFYKNPFPSWIYDLNDFSILEVNDAATEKYGYDRNEFLQLTINDVRPEEDAHDMEELIASRDTPAKIKGRLWRHKKKNGEIMLVEVTIYEIDYFDKKALQVQINDMTEKVRLEKQLAHQQQLKQKQITDAVLKAQEMERKEIGQELHDNINQILAAARLYFDESLLRENQRVDLVRLGMQNITLAIEEIRKLSRALIVPGLNKSGLRQSIEDLIGHILKAKKINIRLDMEKVDETQLSESLKLNVYRIVQEQFNNILKYAEANTIMICIENITDGILLSVSDNGKGFDTRQKRKGVGITNINSRAGLFNGKVEIDSSPGNGCRLNVILNTKVPVSQQAA